MNGVLDPVRRRVGGDESGAGHRHYFLHRARAVGLDEVDWEFMGGSATHVETNYVDKGIRTTYDRAVYYPVAALGSIP